MLPKNFLIIRVIIKFPFHLLLVLVLNDTQVFYTEIIQIQFQRTYARRHVRCSTEDCACPVAQFNCVRS